MVHPDRLNRTHVPSCSLRIYLSSMVAVRSSLASFLGFLVGLRLPKSGILVAIRWRRPSMSSPPTPRRPSSVVPDAALDLCLLPRPSRRKQVCKGKRWLRAYAPVSSLLRHTRFFPTLSLSLSLPLSIYISISVYLYICICISVSIYLSIYIHTHTRARAHAYTYTYTYTHTHTHIYIYIYKYI
jgi:hypothetical protein